MPEEVVRTMTAEQFTKSPKQPFIDLGKAFVALKPKSWRREFGYWIALYGLAAFMFRLPPLG